MTKNHPFHLVSIRPWPLLISLRLFNTFLITIRWLHKFNNYNLIITIPCVILVSIQWWRDVIREATFQGEHTLKVYINIRLGIILFIISEIFFFIAFFWAYFHSSLAPNIDTGQIWPPLGITPFNPFDIPLLNTIILISSGLTVTWSHYRFLINELNECETSLCTTVLLGIYFSLLQLFEYTEAPFSIADSIYGSTFFIATGSHGFHVIIGTTFLYINLLRLKHLQFSSHHHFGFEAAAWYWHFVDVIWLFLYISIYCWGF